MEVVKDRPAQLSARHLAWELARVGTGNVRHGARLAVTVHRKITLAVMAGLAFGLFNHLAPWWLYVPADAGLVGYWVHHLAWPRVATGLTLRERRIMEWLDAVWGEAGIKPAPSIRFDKRRLAVRISRNSWTIELDVNTAEHGIRSAREFCSLWPALKTQAGEGCIGVYLHERKGRHVSMIVVWERAKGDRLVHVAADKVVYVVDTARGGYRHWNPSLGGYVLADHAHAAEYYLSPGEVERITPTLDDDEHDDAIALEDAEELHDHPSHDGHPAAHDDEEPLPTWLSEPPAQGTRAGCNESGRGVQATTPPEQPESWLNTPPTGPPTYEMFAPIKRHTPTVVRPLDAKPGTSTGQLWDALADGLPHPRSELAALTGMTVGSVGNALTKWARIGIVDATPEGWVIASIDIATVAP